jgi:hypothetical protein
MNRTPLFSFRWLYSSWGLARKNRMADGLIKNTTGMGMPCLLEMLRIARA